jgi:hypothetical protein
MPPGLHLAITCTLFAAALVETTRARITCTLIDVASKAGERCTVVATATARLFARRRADAVFAPRRTAADTVMIAFVSGGMAATTRRAAREAAEVRTARPEGNTTDVRTEPDSFWRTVPAEWSRGVAQAEVWLGTAVTTKPMHVTRASTVATARRIIGDVPLMHSRTWATPKDRAVGQCGIIPLTDGSRVCTALSVVVMDGTREGSRDVPHGDRGGIKRGRKS